MTLWTPSSRDEQPLLISNRSIACIHTHSWSTFMHELHDACEYHVFSELSGTQIVAK